MSIGVGDGDPSLRIDLVQYPTYEEASGLVDQFIELMDQYSVSFLKPKERLQRYWIRVFGGHPAAEMAAGRFGAEAFDRIFSECLRIADQVVGDVLRAIRPDDDFLSDGIDEVNVVISPLTLVALAGRSRPSSTSSTGEMPPFIRRAIDSEANVAKEARRKLAIGSMLLLQYVIDPPSEVARDMSAYMAVCREHLFTDLGLGSTYVHSFMNEWEVVGLLVDPRPELDPGILASASGKFGAYTDVRCKEYAVRVFTVGGAQYAVHTHVDMKTRPSIGLKLLRKQVVQDVRRARYVVVAVCSAGSDQWRAAKAEDAIAFASHLRGVFDGRDSWSTENDDGEQNPATALDFFVHKFFVLHQRSLYEDRCMATAAIEVQVTTAASVTMDREVRGHLEYHDRHHVRYRRQQYKQVAERIAI